jgi:hypothetical protein
MERLPGEPLVRAIFSRAAARVPRWLAETQARLHAQDAGVLGRALEAAGLDPEERSTSWPKWRGVRRRLESLGLEGLRAGCVWLRREQPGVGGRDLSTATSIR